MELVKDENGNVKLGENGFPVWNDGTQEVAIDVPRMKSDVHRLNGECAGKRKDYEEVKVKLDAYGGIEPDVARAGAELYAERQAGKLVESGQVKEANAAIEAALSKRHEGIVAGKDKEIEEVNAKYKESETYIESLLIEQAFTNSDYLKSNCKYTPRIMHKLYGDNFKVEKDDSGKRRIVAYHEGSPLTSVVRPGSLADANESIKFYFENDPERNEITASPPGGSGTASSSGKIPSDKNTMSSVDRIAAGLKVRGMGNG